MVVVFVMVRDVLCQKMLRGVLFPNLFIVLVATSGTDVPDYGLQNAINSSVI